MTNTSLAQEEMPLPEATGREYAGTTSMRSLASEIIETEGMVVKPKRSRRRRRAQADEKPAHNANGNNRELTRNTDARTSANDEESYYAYALSRSMRSLDPSLAEEEVRSLNQPVDKAASSDYGPKPTQNDDNDTDMGKASFASSVINLLNTQAGAGILALPSVFAKSGYIGGTLLLIITAFFSIIGMKLLTASIETDGIRNDAPTSFYVLSSVALPNLTWLVDLAVVLKCIGVCISYLITVGDSMVDACRYFLRDDNGERKYEQLLTSRHFWIFVASIVVMPLCFLKTFDSLKASSALGIQLKVALVVCIVLFALGVFDPCPKMLEDVNNIIEAPSTMEEQEAILVGGSTSMTATCRGETTDFTDFRSTSIAVSVFIYAFCYQQNIFPIANEMRDRTKSKMDKAVGYSATFALLLYGASALAGYSTFGDNTKGNILLNYPQTALLTAMRIFVASMLICMYPLQLDPARRCISSLAASYRRIRQESQSRCKNWTDANQSFVSLASEVYNEEEERENLRTEEGFEIVERVPRRKQGEEIDSAPKQISEKRSVQEIAFEFRMTTVFILFVSFAVSNITSDLGFAFAVVGASGSTIIMFILPSLIYLFLHELPATGTMYLLASLQLLIGMFILPTSLYFIVTTT